MAQWYSKRPSIEKRATPHVLRHTFATEPYHVTGKMRLVQKALGHADLSMIYTHVYDEDLASAMRSMGRTGRANGEARYLPVADSAKYNDCMAVRQDDSPDAPGRPTCGAVVFETALGQMVHGEALAVVKTLATGSVDLVLTSPPFGLLTRKDYGNVPADEYVDWFLPYAREIHRILKASGSFVLDTGASWNRGVPTRNLYQFKLLIALCDKVGFHLAQDFFWWNPAKLPTPAEWVTVRRIRVKDAVNCVWWLSKSPWPKASNRRVLQPYTRSMETLFRKGYSRARRPSGHKPSAQFSKNNGAAIPPNLLAVANTDSRSSYIEYCRSEGLQPHPARFPREIPEFFVRMLTDPGETVVDPFAGSSVTGAVCERLERRWLCIDVVEDYLKGAIGRFIGGSEEASDPDKTRNIQYQISRVGSLWDGAGHTSPLRKDGGRAKRAKGRPGS